MNAYRPRIAWRAAVGLIPATCGLIVAIVAFLFMIAGTGCFMIGGALATLTRSAFADLDEWVRGG